MDPDMSMLEHAQHLALDLGWPILPVRPRGKIPLTAHGVKDATTDERTLLHWWAAHPDANIGIATGAPGPTVLDVDQPARAAFLLAQLQAAHPPEAATNRGRHLYYQGLQRGTITLEFGELRGTGSYVVAPPSIHPSGKTYTWLTEPNGTLPAVPDMLAALGRPVGTGTMPAPTGLVGHGQRHDHLKDLATRLVRSGVTDPATIERALRAEYEQACEHDPPAAPDEFAKLAQWAAGTRIAHRERQAPLIRLAARDAPGETIAGHRRVVDDAGGWSPLTVAQVKRYGNRLVDALHIHLDNGRVVDFPQQSYITARGGWARTVIAATDGTADPPSMKDPDLSRLYRSLCVLAGKTRAELEADEHADMLADLCGISEPLTGHSLDDAVGRYQLIALVRARQPWDPADRHSVTRPALIIDSETATEYLRAGDLMAWFRHRGAQIHTREFPGRMAMIGLTQVRLNGRDSIARLGRRATNTAVFYQLPNQPEENPMSDQPISPDPGELDPDADPVEPQPSPDPEPAEPDPEE
jgi:hypothetical protein